MRILAIDYGKKRFGLAMSDPLGLTAQGLPTIVSGGRQKDLEQIAEIVRENGVEKIVVGLPRKMDGTLGLAAREVLAFVEEVKTHLDLPVITWDERLSSKRAEREMISADLSRAKRKGRRDKIAAQLILQSFLDAGKNKQ
ncbi:MAG: Holliday junction resolvase [Planctomycetes bacterium DG_23]|nr:MAG: Holliday junction resolvase [Planctomycetes bacterium DG_23]